MSLADYTPAPAPNEPAECPHENRTLDEDKFRCFECWMAQFEGTSFTMEAEA